MFVINGAIAAFNGFLVRTFRFWCECVRGGVCCNGECHCDEGECCNDEWKTEPGYCCGDESWSPENNPNAPCEAGWTFLRWGDDVDQCCGCVPPAVMNPELNGGIVGAENVAAALCCPSCGGAVFRDEFGECPVRCCENGTCENKKPSECGGVMPGGCCEDAIGCPVPCCTESPDGSVVSCTEVTAIYCPSPSKIDNTVVSCEQACKGACCVATEDGYVLHENSPLTKDECDSVGGDFQGVGTNSCRGCTEPGFPQEKRCREPFDACCCEEKSSTGAGLTFYQPRNKRMPPLSDTAKVTVQFTTSSPIRIHGELFGASAYEQCNETLIFLLCWDAFNVEPVPCGSNFKDLKIKVCWDQYSTDVEPLEFSGCNDITVWLGNCIYECETVLFYEGPGHTSNANIVMFGDGTIRADGTGPLVLTSNITHGGNCSRTLTLDGSNDQENEVRRILDPSGSPVCHVVKDGSGRWRLNTNSRQFNGDLTVKNGTLQISNGGAAGSTVKMGGGETASFLLERNVTATCSFEVKPSTGRILIGGVHAIGNSRYASGEIRMEYGVTLAATTGGTVEFSNTWAGSSSGSVCQQDVHIGAAGFAGTVLLYNAGTYHTTKSVTIAFGDVIGGFDAVISADDGLFLQNNTSLRITKTTNGIDPSTPVTAATATLTLEPEPGDPAVSQSLDELIVTGTLTLNGSGSLTVANLSGTGGIVNEDGTLTLNHNSMTGSMSITGGSVIVNEPITNPGGLLVSATFTSSTLTVAFSGDPQSGAAYVLLAGPTVNSYWTVTLTGTTKTSTYNSATSTLTIA